MLKIILFCFVILVFECVQSQKKRFRHNRPGRPEQIQPRIINKQTDIVSERRVGDFFVPSKKVDFDPEFRHIDDLYDEAEDISVMESKQKPVVFRTTKLSNLLQFHSKSKNEFERHSDSHNAEKFKDESIAKMVMGFPSRYIFQEESQDVAEDRILTEDYTFDDIGNNQQSHNIDEFDADNSVKFIEIKEEPIFLTPQFDDSANTNENENDQNVQDFSGMNIQSFFDRLSQSDKGGSLTSISPSIRPSPAISSTTTTPTTTTAATTSTTTTTTSTDTSTTSTTSTKTTTTMSTTTSITISTISTISTTTTTTTTTTATTASSFTTTTTATKTSSTTTKISIKSISSNVNDDTLHETNSFISDDSLKIENFFGKLQEASISNRKTKVPEETSQDGTQTNLIEVNSSSGGLDDQNDATTISTISYQILAKNVSSLTNSETESKSIKIVEKKNSSDNLEDKEEIVTTIQNLIEETTEFTITNDVAKNQKMEEIEEVTPKTIEMTTTVTRRLPPHYKTKSQSVKTTTPPPTTPTVVNHNMNLQTALIINTLSKVIFSKKKIPFNSLIYQVLPNVPQSRLKNQPRLESVGSGVNFHQEEIFIFHTTLTELHVKIITTIFQLMFYGLNYQ